jgi:uncharacterized SAM-binding protein YcdF (DUF218 family)
VYAFVSYLLRPYTLILILMGLALFIHWRRQREQRRRLLWLALPFLALVVLSMPAVGHLVVGSLEWRHPPLNERPEGATAIVVLGGGVLAPELGGELDSTSLYRCLHAASLYRQGKPCLVVVSGGKPDPTVPGPACADLMAAFLIQLGARAEDVIVENRSRTTYENAVESRKLLEERQVRQIVLVTEAVHLHRALLCFRKEGLEVMPSGCHYQKTEFKPSLYDFLPALSGLSDCETAAHEWLGLAWYGLRGRT